MATATVSPLATAPPPGAPPPAGAAHRRRLRRRRPRPSSCSRTLAVYLQVRADFLASGGHRPCPTTSSCRSPPADMGMVTLLMSVVTVAWAV